MDESAAFAWETSEFRQLLAAQRPGKAFALVRRAHGLSQADFGVLLGWERTHTGRVEREEVGTLFDIRESTRVADALGIPRRALLPLLLGTAEVGTIDGSEGEGVDTVNRRQFGQTGVILFGAVLATGAQSPVPDMRVGSDHITYIRRTTERLWEHDNLAGAGGIAETGIRQYQLARQLLDSGDYGSRIGDELVEVTGHLTDCAAWLAYDNGNVDIARALFTQLALLAEESGNDSFRISSLANLSFITNEQPRVGNDSQQRSREAVRQAQRASELVRRVPSVRWNAIRAANEAVAHAYAGDTTEFQRAVNRAWREADRGLEDLNSPIKLEYVTESELCAREANGRMLLGQNEKAVELYRRSLASETQLLPRDEASYRTRYSVALARLGDNNAAISEGLSALTLLDGPVKSRRLVNGLQPVRTVAEVTRTDDAELFSHRLDCLTVGS